MGKSGKIHHVKSRENINIRDIEEKLIKARISLLIRQPFFGNMATRLTLENADSWCDTAATDGRKFYYNPGFIDKLTPGQTEFLFAHEVLHNAFEHMLRRHDRNPLLFNIAADYAVNQILLDEHIGEKIEHTLQDEKYKGLAAEEIYDDLFRNAHKINIQDLADKILDEHLDGNDDDDRPKLSDSERQKIRDEIKESLLSAASTAGAGNTPAGVARLVENISSPKMNWRELLRQHLQSVVKSDYSFLTHNKKNHCTQFKLPGLKRDDTIDICVAIDTSGSIDDKMLSDALSEVAGIMNQYDDYRIHVWSFDTTVHNAVVFTPNDCDILKYNAAGGGGTDFTCNYKYMRDNDIVPKTLIFITDMRPFGSWGDENYCDTIFCANKYGHGITAPYGTTINLD